MPPGAFATCLVNGQWALREGKLLDRFPGRPLKHRG